jgi:gamma-glutamyltranspeptidase/glutathione hydrolase
MTVADLAGYKPEWVDTIGIEHAGHRLHEIPPNGQGIAALIALGILHHFDLASLPVDGVDSQHLQIEAMKLAFADAYRYVADPAGMAFPCERPLDELYLATRAPDRHEACTAVRAGNPVKGGTIYLTAADERG